MLVLVERCRLDLRTIGGILRTIGGVITDMMRAQIPVLMSTQIFCLRHGGLGGSKHSKKNTDIIFFTNGQSAAL